ncbi:MAG TPA: nuclease-related domain-containing protein [bacterium]|nr:nuclease-related domain-containing protein [bacterium]
MVATLQKLQPPRAMRWVTRWKWITIILVAVGIGVAIRLEHWTRWIVVPVILGGAYYAFTVFRHRGRIVGQGSEGEALVANVLDNLHDMDARVLHSVQFESGDRPREIDHLLISHNTMFVIETKYLRGRIAGEALDREWTLHKRARQTRSRYKRTFYNPLKQVATQIYHLRSHLESNLAPRWAQECSQIWIQGVVVFAHPQGDASAVINHENGVVDLANLPQYLANYRPPSRAHRLSYGLRREIARVLTGQ